VKQTPPDLEGVYEDDLCPDCGLEIPRDADDGVACGNCGHVFWQAKGDPV